MQKIKAGMIALFVFGMPLLFQAQQNPVVKYLPASAASVTTINFTSLFSKVSPETFHQGFLYREMMKKPNPELAGYLSNPSKLGPDFTKDFFLVFDKPAPKKAGEKKPKSKTPNFTLIGQLKDVNAFEEKMQQFTGGADSAIQHEGGNNVVAIKDGLLTVGWNNEIFALRVGMAPGVTEKIQEMMENPGDKDMEKVMEQAMAESSRMTNRFLFDLLTPKTSNGFLSNTSFNAMLNENADIRNWGKGFSQMLNQDIPAELESIIPAFIKDQEKFGITRFVNGKVETITHTSLSPELAQLRSKYSFAPVSSELIQRIPAGNIMGCMQFSTNPEAAKEYLAKMGMNTLLDSFQKKLPFDMKDLMGAVKGNGLFAVIQPDASLGKDTAKGFLGDMQLVGVIDIADAQKFESVKEAITTAMHKMNNKEGDEEEGGPGKKLSGFHLSSVVSGEHLYFSTSAKLAALMAQGSSGRAIPAWFPQDNHAQMLISISFKDLIGQFLLKSKMEDPEKPDPEMLQVLNKMGEMVMYGGNMENNQMVMHTEFRFADPDKNAMSQLFEIMDLAVAAADKQKAEQRKRMESQEMEKDDIAVPPPPPPAPKKPVKKPATTPAKPKTTVKHN